MANLRCVDCGATFAENAPGSWHKVEGWKIERHVSGVTGKPQGGINSLRDLRYLGQAVCPPCGRLRAAGVIPGQRGLL
jgi:hypothetical protein